MLPTNLSSIDFECLRRICNERWSETINLEFKSEVPNSSDKDKHELMKDIAALANAEGGDIIYGIKEQDYTAEEIIPIESEEHDVLIRRLNQVIESGIEPRIPGIQFHNVSLDRGYALIVRIPSSFQAPHTIKVNNHRRFVMRSGTNTSDMTYDQIRLAFDRSATLLDKTRSFIQTRLIQIEHRKTPKRMKTGPVMAAHFIPINGIAGKQFPDLDKIYNGDYLNLRHSNWTSLINNFNLDGVLVFPITANQSENIGYYQIFRSGAIESVVTCWQNNSNPDGTEKRINAKQVSDFFVEILKKFKEFSILQGFSGPAVVQFSLFFLDEYKFVHNPYGYDSGTSDRPNLIPQEVWIDQIDELNVEKIAQNVLDVIWQGFNFERCIYFDKSTGAYKPIK